MRSRKARSAAAAVSAIVAVIAAPLPAAVSTDSSLGHAPQTLSGPNFQIGASLGEQRGGNLFHSFRQFDLAAGEAATFSGPTSVHNILARVTGGTASNIDGTIRCTIPDANFYLINPSGVVFGPDATLDVRGSFAVTTADVVKLADGGVFHASNPSASVLTTASPAAFGFLGASPAAVTLNGSTLAVPGRRTIGIVSGSLQLSGATLRASGGAVTVVAAGAAGEVRLDPADPAGAVDLTGMPERAAVDLTGSAHFDADGAGGGRVLVRASDLTLADSKISGVTTGASNGAGVDIDLTGVLSAHNSSVLSATIGAGRAGALSINADEVLLNGVDANFLTIDSGCRNIQATGDAGALQIRANRLTVQNGALISANTNGAGNAGAVTLAIAGEMTMDLAQNFTGVVSQSNLGATGNAGSVTIAAGSLTMKGGTQINADTFGPGNAGILAVTATGALVLDGTGSSTVTSISSGANPGSTGNAGSVQVHAGSMQLLNGAQVSSGTFGPRDAGSVSVIVANDLTLKGTGSTGGASSISSQANSGATGNAGSVTVEAANLTLQDSGQISTGTFGSGNAGSVTVSVANALLLDGTGSTGATGIFSSSDGAGSGNAGNINVHAGSMSLSSGGQISSDTSGPGTAGNVSVAVAGDLSLTGAGDANLTSISSDANEANSGNAGSVTVQAETLTLQNAEISSSTFGRGNAGSVMVQAGSLAISGGAEIRTDTFDSGNAGSVSVSVARLISIDGLTSGGSHTGISSDTSSTISGGDGGTVDVNAGTLLIEGGAQISSRTAGLGNAGRVTVTVARTALLDGSDAGSAFNGISSNSDNVGAGGTAGDVKFQSRSLFIFGGSEIGSSTLGQGAGGSVVVSANHIVLDGSGSEFDSLIDATSQNTGAGGPAGAVTVLADTLHIRNGAEISSDTSGAGDAGDVAVGAGVITLNGARGNAGIAARSLAKTAGGNSGLVIVTSNDLSLSHGAFLSTRTASDSDAGQVRLLSKRLTMTGRAIVSSLAEGTGRAGGVLLEVGDALKITSRSKVLTTAAKGTGGDINIRLGGTMSVDDASITTAAAGDGGNISIDPTSIALRNATISANSSGAAGGNITLRSDGLLQTNSTITATGVTSSGVVNVTPPDTQLAGAITPLGAALDTGGVRLAPTCGLSLRGDISSFIITGVGAEAPQPTGWMPDFSLDLRTSWSKPRERWDR